MPVFKIGSAPDAHFADPILWASATGNIDYGELNDGVIQENMQIGFFRPNQLFPNGGRLRGFKEVTGKSGDGILLTSTDTSRVIISSSPNLKIEDIEFDDTSLYSIQSCEGSLKRILSPRARVSVTGIADQTFEYCYLDAHGQDISGGKTFTKRNCVTLARDVIRANSMLVSNKSISLAPDFILGRGVYSGSETLVNDCYIKESAPVSDFGAGSSNNTLNYNATDDFVDLANGDYRIKLSSPLHASGVGAFFEESSVVDIDLALRSSDQYVQCELLSNTFILQASLKQTQQIVTASLVGTEVFMESVLQTAQQHQTATKVDVNSDGYFSLNEVNQPTHTSLLNVLLSQVLNLKQANQTQTAQQVMVGIGDDYQLLNSEQIQTAVKASLNELKQANLKETQQHQTAALMDIKHALNAVLKHVEQHQTAEGITIVDIVKYSSLEAYQHQTANIMTTYTAVMPDLDFDSVIAISISQQLVCDSISENLNATLI